jgi:CMD domain protein
MTGDVIEALAGLAPGSPLVSVRQRKPVTRAYAQASHAALFAPPDPSEVSVTERFAVAAFVAGLHGDEATAAFYGAELAGAGALLNAVKSEVARGRTTGPYGAYPAGPLSREDKTGPVYHPADAALGARLTAAFAHAHMLVFHPRDANAAALQALLDAGWSVTGIVTLSQLVAFLAFQVRAAAGLRTLAETPA